MKDQRGLWAGIGIAIATGFFFRILFGAMWTHSFFAVMSISCLFVVPLLMGFITVFFAEKEEKHGITFSIFIPWTSIFGLLVITILMNVEGWACWIMALPAFLISSSLGGIVAHKWRMRKRDKLQLSIVFILPFLIAPIEHFIGDTTHTYKAYTEIEIRAGKETIWANVTRVKAINQLQDSASFTRFLGFPRPIEAQLDTDAIGGRRKAIFDKGLVFDERVIAYQPYKLMVFTIHANPYDIPSTTMDKHIVVGGEYFDVLNGTYQLDEASNGVYKLRLYSNFKLHTTFNFYADIWAGLIMKDIQQNILKVIKERSETKS